MKRSVIILLTIFVVDLFLPANMLFAQSRENPRPIPPNDTDIERIIQKTKAFEEFARQCSVSECPEVDCKSAQEAFDRLSDAREYLRILQFWLQQAAAAERKQFENRARTGIETGERLEKVQRILAYQEYVINIASTMLDITSAAENLKGILKNEKSLKDMSRAELAQHLDTFYEGLKDFESAERTLKSGVTAQSNASGKSITLGSDELDSYKSTLSNLKSVVDEYQKNGKDWRKAFTSSGGSRALLSIIGRLAKVYGESEMRKRRAQIDPLVNELAGSDRIQRKLFEQLLRVQERRRKAELAFAGVNKLLDASPDNNGASITRCLLKIGNACPLLNVNRVSNINVPIMFKTFDPRVAGDNGINRTPALIYLNQKLATVEALLRPVPKLEWETEPFLEMYETSFSPNDVVRVKFKAPRCYPSNSWAGIVPTSVPHGDELTNRGKLLGLQNFLRHRSEGEFVFNAPKKTGSYDIRMNNAASGREVKSVTFTVNAASGNLELEVFDALDKSRNTHITIYQNGKEVVGAWTKHSPLKLPPGNYEVVFDYALGIRRIVQVRIGEIAKEVVRDVSGRLRLEVFNAAGKLKSTHVTIYRGDEEVVGMWTEHAPIDLPPGAYTVKFDIGDDGVTRSVTINRGQTSRLWLLDN